MRSLCGFICKARSLFHHGPFTATIQVRLKKPADTAQTRLDTRVIESKLNILASRQRRLDLVLRLYARVSVKKRWPFVSVQLLSQWAAHEGINTLSIGDVLRKYPHVFEVFTHQVHRNFCCKFTPKFVELLKKEDEIVFGLIDAHVIKIKKLLSMSINGRIHIHAIRLIRRELGLPENFVDLIIRQYSDVFRMVDAEIIAKVSLNESQECLDFVAEIEKWREKEYKEKWLSEFETKYSFRIDLPTGFTIVPGFRERLKNWQRLSYVKPYEKQISVRVRTCGGIERYEKRAVGVIHELLCLTVEKMLEVERLAHFKKDFGIEVNVRELLLKHPGIFYVSTRGNTQMVFLKEAYCKGCLVEPNPISDVRRELLGLIMLGCRKSRELREQKNELKEERKDAKEFEVFGGALDADFVIPILESLRQ